MNKTRKRPKTGGTLRERRGLKKLSVKVKSPKKNLKLQVKR